MQIHLLKNHIEHKILQSESISYKYHNLYSFSNTSYIIELESATLEGSCNQLRALCLQILHCYQMLKPGTPMNKATVGYIIIYQRM